MKRLSIRPRPLDIHKKLPLVAHRQDLDGDEIFRCKDLEQVESVLAATPAKKVLAGSEIPTPQFVVVGSYERNYTRTFLRPQSYIRARSAKSRSANYCEYDLDGDDEHWLSKFDSQRRILPAEKFELMLYKLEIGDHDSKLLAPEYGVPTPVSLSREKSAEALGGLSTSTAVLGAVFDYWKGKRESLQKPLLRRFQPAPPVDDPSPFHVFRSREIITSPHTRLMQRRENDTQYFKDLSQVRHILDQAGELMRLIKREEKKRERVLVKSNTQRSKLKLEGGQYARRDSERMEGEGRNSTLGGDFGAGDRERLALRAGHLEDNRRLISTSDSTQLRLQSLHGTVAACEE